MNEIEKILFLMERVDNEYKKIVDVRKDVNKHPSEKQKEAGNYKKGHVIVNGFEITIENPKGSIRSGVDTNGKKWEIKMNNDYGYFAKTLGKDGDHIDVFIGNKLKSPYIFVVDQNNLEGKFDESKVMLGFENEKEAKDAYMSNYSKDWKGFDAITKVEIEDFKEWLYDGKRQSKPFSQYKQSMKENKEIKNILSLMERMQK